MIRVAAAADFHAGPESAGTLAPLLTGLKDEADLLLLAGDLTRAGNPAEAEIVAAELADVGIPVIAVLGNHDYHGGQVPEITRILNNAGIHVLDRDGIVLDVNGQRVAIAGAKGFGGGFDAALAEDFGEPEMRQWIGYAEAEAEALEDALSALVGDVRIALLHYAPIPDTLSGERLKLYPFLGNSMLGEAIDRAGADLVVHGHSHQGSLAGATPGGAPVRNVARAVIRAPYTVFTIERDDELPVPSGLAADRLEPGWWARGHRLAVATASDAGRGAERDVGCEWTLLNRLDSPPALTSTLHDPDNSVLAFLERESIARALGGYAAVVVAVTAASDPRVTRKLETLGVRVVPGGLAGEGRRAALRAAGPDHAAYFSCDFDRWLRWVDTWPEELASLPARVARLGSRGTAPPWYVCLGRTARAFRTHPAAQRLPETATNRALSLAAGRSLDAVAGAAWLTPEAVAIVLAESREPTAATDLEWPALILRRDPARLRGLRCEGLSWETPDFHTADIAAAGGLHAWTRAVYDTPAMWTARLRLATDSTAALERVLGESLTSDRT